MGKPAVVMFVGVDSLSDKDESKLPSGMREIFQNRVGEITIGNITFECIDGGNSDSADPGDFVGFGVVFYREWWDNGAVDCNPTQIAQQASEILVQVQNFFTQWHLTTKPKTFTCCVYRS